MFSNVIVNFQSAWCAPEGPGAQSRPGWRWCCLRAGCLGLHRADNENRWERIGWEPFAEHDVLGFFLMAGKKKSPAGSPRKCFIFRETCFAYLREHVREAGAVFQAKKEKKGGKEWRRKRAKQMEARCNGLYLTVKGTKSEQINWISLWTNASTQSSMEETVWEGENTDES